MIVRREKNSPGPPGPDELVFIFVSKSVEALADIHGAVGAPFPAAVIGEERPMVVMTMSEKAIAEMTMADSVANSMAAVAAMAAVTAGESLAGDGERGGGQRESGNRRGNDGLELRHGRRLLRAGRVSLRDDPPLEVRAVMRCDGGHSVDGALNWSDSGIEVSSRHGATIG
jgi:hypothetical protein